MIEPQVTKEQYLHQVQFALLGCQLVEEALKSFLMYARDVNRILPSEFSSIAKSDDELDETPLGPLIKLFRTVSTEKDLIAQLELLRPERNHCARRAFFFAFVGDVRSDIRLDVELDRVSKTATLAWACFEALKPQLLAAEARLRILRQQTAG